VPVFKKKNPRLVGRLRSGEYLQGIVTRILKPPVTIRRGPLTPKQIGSQQSPILTAAVHKSAILNTARYHVYGNKLPVLLLP